MPTMIFKVADMECTLEVPSETKTYSENWGLANAIETSTGK